MGDYKEDPNAKDDELTIPEEELRNKIIRKQQVQTEVNKDVPSACKKYESFDGDVQSASPELERPKTPEYDELNRRFQSLLCSINTRTHSEISCEDEDDVFLEQSLPPGHVQLSCSKPPDILDFTRRSVSDIDLEDVNITLDGIEIVSETEEELPSHIQDLVDKAMKDM